MLYLIGLSAEEVVVSSEKSKFDYAIVFIVVITWFRFFNYFLLANRLARLIVTLYQMVIDTMSFTFLIILVLIISATAFTTRFASVDPRFESMWETIKYLFDAMVSNYEFEDFGVFQRSFSIFLMIFLFTTNIFLLNFMIAIIDAIYQHMLSEGAF